MANYGAYERYAEERKMLQNETQKNGIFVLDQSVFVKTDKEKQYLKTMKSAVKQSK